MVISFGLLAAVMGSLALVGAICLWLAGLWLLPIVYLALSAAAVVGLPAHAGKHHAAGNYAARCA